MSKKSGMVDSKTEPNKMARGRMDLSTPELWLMLAGAFTTIYYIFTYFTTIGGLYGSNYLQLNNLLNIIARIFVYLAYGFTIYLTAMLSLYFDDQYIMSKDQVLSSDFVITRLLSSIARAIVLGIALVLITNVNLLQLPVPSIPL